MRINLQTSAEAINRAITLRPSVIDMKSILEKSKVPYMICHIVNKDANHFKERNR